MQKRMYGIWIGTRREKVCSCHPKGTLSICSQIIELRTGQNIAGSSKVTLILDKNNIEYLEDAITKNSNKINNIKYNIKDNPYSTQQKKRVLRDSS